MRRQPPAAKAGAMLLALLIPFALLAIAMSAAPARVTEAALALDEEVRMAVILTFAGTIGIAALALV